MPDLAIIKGQTKSFLFVPSLPLQKPARQLHRRKRSDAAIWLYVSAFYTMSSHISKIFSHQLSKFLPARKI
jgi:hypothetical protein